MEESYDKPRQHIKKQRHYFANKGPSSQGYGFSCGHVWMWELEGHAVAEVLIFWLPDAKIHLIEKDPDAGKDWRQKKRVAGDEAVR